MSIVSHFVLYVAHLHNCIGESLANQTVGNLTLFKGQRVFVDLAHASHDVNPSDFLAYRSTLIHVLKSNVFPDARAVNVKREPKSRYLTGDGVTRSLGVEVTTKIMSQVLRAVFEFSGVRRTPGLAGHLKRYKVKAENTLRYEYLDADYLPTAWPNSMVLQVSTPPFDLSFCALISSRRDRSMMLLRESTALRHPYSRFLHTLLLMQVL